MNAARARMRACLQCPCGGDPGPAERDEEIEGVHVTLERLTGTTPTGCLWWGMREPIVADVLDLYRTCRSEAGATLAAAAALDPPQRVWAGLLHYAEAHDRVRAEEMRHRRETADHDG